VSPGPVTRWLRFLQLIWAPRAAEIRSRRACPRIHAQPKD
jgi:hypothetical protein